MQIRKRKFTEAYNLVDGSTEVRIRRSPVELERGTGERPGVRSIVVTASDDSRDRYGDRILVDGVLSGKKFGEGWQTKDFERNPVFMPFHKYDTMPLGQVSRLWRDTKGRRKRLRARIAFADSPEGNAFFSAYQAGTLRAVSVGFAPLQIHDPTSEQERKELGLGPKGLIHATSDLLELSAVSIPANPGAVMEQVCEGDRCSVAKFADRLDGIDRELAFEVRSAWRLGPRRQTFDLGGRRQADPKLEKKWSELEGAMLRLMVMTRKAAGMTTRDWRNRR